MTKKKKTNLPAVRRTPVAEISPEQQIVGAALLGKVRRVRDGVAELLLEAPLSVGDSIRVKGHSTDLTQKVERLTVAEQSVHSASPGESVAVAVADRVREGDAVYKL